MLVSTCMYAIHIIRRIGKYVYIYTVAVIDTI